MSKCSDCSRVFSSRAAYEQHTRALQHGSAKFQQSRPSKAAATASLLERLEAPVNSDGEWVWRADFEGTKSFGFFKCDKRKNGCGKTWVSAHAFPNYTQGCKRCERSSHPVALWLNYDHEYSSDDGFSSDEFDTPHDMARCAACRAGVCLL